MPLSQASCPLFILLRALYTLFNLLNWQLLLTFMWKWSTVSKSRHVQRNTDVCHTSLHRWGVHMRSVWVNLNLTLAVLHSFGYNTFALAFILRATHFYFFIHDYFYSISWLAFLCHLLWFSFAGCYFRYLLWSNHQREGSVLVSCLCERRE